MKKFKRTRKIVALLLSLSLITGMMPATALSAFAATGDTPEYLFFASDRHANASIIGTLINNMEKNIGENKLDYLGLGGDMDGSGGSHPTYNSSTVLGEVIGATSSLSATNVDIVAGIHDMNVNDDAGIVLPYSGGGAQIYEGDNYYVYGVPESCISGEVSGVDPETEANDFVTWANGDDVDKSKVIFVLSHYPLHQRRKDNDGAVYWANALNKVAAGDDTAIDRDVAFFWGHNHTSEASADTAVYHVAPNGSISVQGGSSNQTIYFTYANAGYLNSHSSATLVTVTDETITFDKYKNSSVSTTNTVTRVVQEETKTLKGISVTGETEYTVGGTGLNLTVTATYDDGTTADVTEDATFEPAELTVSGTYTITASYGGKTDTIDVKVNLYAEDEAGLIGVEAFSQGASALEVTWADEAEKILEEKGLYTDYVVYDLGLTNPGETTEYAMSLVDGMDTANLVVYHVTDDGELTLIEHKIVNDCVVFNTSLTGIFAYGSVAVPEGYTLASIAMKNIPTDLFVGGSLDLMDAVITATYTKEGAEDFVRNLTVYDYDETNFSGFDVNVAGAQTVKFTYEGVTAELPIRVWGDEFKVNDVTVRVGEGEYGVTEAVVAESTNVNVANAIQKVINGDNYVAYDITLNYSDGYAANKADKTVTLPIPDGVTNPVVYYVSDSGKSVVDMEAVNNGDRTVTFTTTHFSTYVVGEGVTITVPDNETATGSTTIGGKETKDVYMLTTSISSGNEYLIVDTKTAGAANILARNGSSALNTTGTVVTDNNGTYIVLEDANDELWTYGSVRSSGNTIYTFKNGSYYLYYTGTNRTLALTTSTPERSWSYSNNQLVIRSRYLKGGSSWSLSTSESSVYFYVKTSIEVDTTTTVSGTYSIEGRDEAVAAVKDATVDLSSILTFAPTSGTATTEDVSETATYEVYDTDTTDSVKTGDPLGVITKIEGNMVTLSGNTGKALVKVSYDTNGDAADGIVTDYITISATTPDHFDIQLHKADMTEAKGVTADNVTNYYIFNIITGVYEKATSYTEGQTYYTTPVIQGDEITDTIALKGIKAGDTYSVWAVVKAFVDAYDTEGTELGTLGDALTWTVSDESIAKINKDTGVITFTGTNYGTFTVTVAYEGADGKVITDTITLSVTKTLFVVPGDGTNDFPEYPNEGAVRFDKTATAVGNFSETGIAQVELSMTGVPYSIGSSIDVLLMLDMSTSMDVSVSDNETRKTVTVDAASEFVESIVKNSDGTYNTNKVAVAYFNGSKVVYVTGTKEEGSGAYASINDDDTLKALQTTITGIADKSLTSSGTYYGTANASAWTTMQAQDKVSDSKQAYVFMSDGGPTEYTYVNGDSYTTAGQDSSSTIVGWFDTTTGAAKDTFKTEYYTHLMKKAEYPVYTVGLGLAQNSKGPQAYTKLDSAVHEALTSHILTSMATSASQFYNIADEDAAANMGNIFSGIAASIKEAAKDIVVEDKIGSNYTVNFGLPNGVTSDATDGVSEFYIQVVDYVLDSTTHERTGAYTVKENFTFNSNGTLKRHTVDGITCTDCSHVTTTTDGTITKIEGTYFSYEDKGGKGEYLNWEEDKLTSNELALQYFVYLNNSAGEDVQDQIAAGTYYTNEYATLTYTNVNGNDVQQEFPKPQMTWNGAQVSYVFYLVNEAGQPVNRAGRVVPFAEAVYVTDTYTHAITWNDMEQSAGLEAEYLAENIVPDVYALYDNDASYNIHVYEKESAVNLNNHFVIGGNVKDDYNTVTNSWENANTTYVFNNKSNATKYNTVGTYVADDKDATLNETGLSYFCKSAKIEGATFTKTVENDVTVYTVTGVGSGYQSTSGETQTTVAQIEAAGGSTTGGTVIGNYVYYVDENEEVYTIVTKTDGKEVDKGFDFHNTTVAFAVVWKPELKPDTVVVDYGLDVVVDVTRNDALASGVVGVRADAPNVAINSGTYTAAKEESAYITVDGTNNSTKVATATVENMNAVRFSLNKDNSMNFNAPAKFYYESDVNYYNTSNELQSTSMYSSVTVIPATTVYYEDDFVTFTDSGKAYDVTDENGEVIASYGKWIVDGTALNKTQDQDRPGESQISKDLDADNVYGYDSVYDNMSKYSMGSAHKVKVESGVSGMASFDFYGTGFDVISMTDNTTGLIVVNVYDESDTLVKSLTVDTYYGYAKNDNGEWEVVSPSAPNAIYQVPVMKVEGLDYGKYTAKIVASYNSAFDHNKVDSYDFYLDAIRIYDPANDGASDTTIEHAYEADGEGWPTYIELRNKLIEAKQFGGIWGDDDEDTEADERTVVEGLMFIDGDASIGDAQIEDYKAYGPNNEVYLAPGQRVAFMIADVAKNKLDEDGNEVVAENGNVEKESIVEHIHIGIKSVDGAEATYTITNIAKESNTETGVKAGQYYGEKTNTVNTATDMYYNLTGYKGDIIVISNTGNHYGTDGIISLTNIKTTYKENPVTVQNTPSPIKAFVAEEETSIYMTPAAAKLTLKSLNTPVVPEIPVVPDAPVVPEEPDTPVVPDTPVTPEEPETPVVPDTPVTPEQPDTPTVPDKPEVDEPEVEKPAKPTVTPAKVTSVKTDKKTYTQGDSVKVTVTTNDEATKVKIGTKTLKTFKTVKGKKTWTTTVKASKIGKLSIGAVAYNKQGTASKKVTKTVTVKQFAPKKFTTTLSKSKVKKGAKYTVTVKTSTDVKYVKVNGKKITKFTYDKKKVTKTFKVTYKATKVGKKKVKVYSYNKTGYASKAKSKTVTVKRK